MRFLALTRSPRPKSATGDRRRSLPKGRRRCSVEVLEDRTLLSACSFDAVLTVGHVDGVAVDYLDSGWSFSVYNNETDTRYTPDQALLVALPAAKTGRPSGDTWDFLGTSAGSDIWILPQSQNPDLLFLGSNSERTSFTALESYFEEDSRVRGTAPWIKVSLVEVRGPGHFSVWQTDSFGQPTVWMATGDGISSEDAFFTVAGGHIHFNWGFTARGYYEVDVRASAFLPGETTPTVSTTSTFFFAAEQPGCLQFTTTSYEVSETGMTATITVTRTNGSDGPVTVDYATSNGTAVAGTDYTAASGTLTFENGETSKTFTVQLAPDDTEPEASKTINLTLSSPSGGARLGSPVTATLTILDNDSGGAPVLEAISDRPIPATQDLINVSLSANGDPLTFSAVVESLAYVLDQERGLFSDGNFWENYGGLNEKWVRGAGDLWYFLLPNGELYRSDGGSGATGTLVGTPGASYYQQPELLYQAQAARDLDAALGLAFAGDFFQNYGGQQERWLQGADNLWYFLLPTGDLYRWDGMEGQATGALIAALGAGHYADPRLLYDAASGQLLASPSFSGTVLSLDRYDGFVGSFVVTVTVSDGSLTDSKTFTVTVTS